MIIMKKIFVYRSVDLIPFTSVLLLTRARKPELKST